jgi:acetyl esterase/lipase
MRALKTTTVLACAVLSFVLSLWAEEQPAERKTRQQQRWLHQFDKDKNGKLDDQEKQTLREHQKAKQGGASQPAQIEIPPGVKRIADVEYARVNDHPLLLDIYLPEKPNELLPVIVWVHGGAWVSGNKTLCPIASFAAKGYAVLSINYRLTTTAQFPAQINDCKAAVRWVRAHAAEYGFDPAHVGAAGGSAGGHLVALLGTSGEVKELEGDVGGNLKYNSRVQAVCDFCGPTDFTREDYVKATPPTTRPAILEQALTKLLGGPWEQKREAARLASPVHFISKDDPPFLIVHGDADDVIPVKHSRILHDKLKAASLDSTLLVVKNAGHGVAASPGVLDQTAAFFDHHLRKKVTN